eukprot:1735770-Rhodomonas_salina.2
MPFQLALTQCEIILTWRAHQVNSYAMFGTGMSYERDLWYCNIVSSHRTARCVVLPECTSVTLLGAASTSLCTP